MKKAILLFAIVLTSFNFCPAQDWFTSYEAAKRFALAQDKLLFVMWEDSFNYPYPVKIENDKGYSVIIDLTIDSSLDSIIWNYFIPVKINESKFAEMSDQILETRGSKYFNKLEDDSIKIMDVNGNILNINTSVIDYENLTLLIKKYSLDTSYLKRDLTNYSIENNFSTAFRLASKYLDYAIFAEKDIRIEIIELANIYFEEARNHLIKNGSNNKVPFLQKLDLNIMREYLILNNPRKVNRLLKRIESADIDETNQPIYCFLYYTTFMLLEDEENTAFWKSKVSEIDLKKADLIININR